MKPSPPSLLFWTVTGTAALSVDWGGLLGTAIVQDPGRFGSVGLHRRGGRIPAPIQGYRN